MMLIFALKYPLQQKNLQTRSMQMLNYWNNNYVDCSVHISVVSKVWNSISPVSFEFPTVPGNVVSFFQFGIKYCVEAAAWRIKVSLSWNYLQYSQDKYQDQTNV